MLSNRQIFLQHLAQTSQSPLMLEIERAEGMYLYESTGKAYIDLIAGISVSNIGHAHPEVVKAVKAQAEKYMHLMVYGEFVGNPQVNYAKQLLQLLPTQLHNIYFTNSGTEATEGAMKLAKRFTGRTQFAYFRNGYHGSTQGALSLMGDESYKKKYRPLLPDTLQLEFNDVKGVEKITASTAAVVVEPVQAESGVTAGTPAFISALRKRCDETGALLIFDEAQTAFGRTGKMFAFEHYAVVPDILLLAKALGGGMPLGSFIASREMMQTLSQNPALGHITTFGGHPVCCASGLAALEVMLNENLLQTVETKGSLFEQLLLHPKINAVRRSGLMLALEFESFDMNKKIIDGCLQRGVLTDWFLFAPNCLRIAPPLIIKEEEIRSSCKAILDSIANS